MVHSTSGSRGHRLGRARLPRHLYQTKQDIVFKSSLRLIFILILFTVPIMKRLIIALLCLSMITSMSLSFNQMSLNSQQTIHSTSYEIEHMGETFECSTNTILFSSPDSSYDVLMNFLNRTQSDLLIATYQFNCQFISERVSTLAYEGINVTVMVDGEPVDGLSGSTLSSLTRIQNAGGNVNVVKGPEFTHFHGKYIIRDGTHVLITSENLGRNGFSKEPTWGNRGWGVIVNCTSLTNYYREVYLNDLNYSSPISPSVYLEPYEPFTGYYKPRFDSQEVHGSFKFTPITAPETSYELINMVQSAEKSIYVQQFYIRHWGDKPNPLVEELKNAALRGVEVKIQLDSTWFHTEENLEITNQLNDYAEERGIALEARLVEYRQGFQSVHNKGMIVDGSKVLVSSINWNENSYSNNREIALIIENGAVGEYFSSIFLNDWKMLPNRPIADAGRDIHAEVNEIITLDGGFSWDHKNISIYQWDLTGDGIYDKEGRTVKWTFNQAGTYEVTLRVIDKEGDTDTDTVNIYVREQENSPVEKRRLSSFMLLPILILAFVWLSKKVVDV